MEQRRKQLAAKLIQLGMSILTGIAALLVLLWLAVFALGIRPYIVMSGSMEPAILTGSVCFVNTNVPYEEIKEGDVVSFRLGQGMVTHRVVCVTEEGLETKGDANDCADGITTTRENYCGETVWSIPYAGYVLYAIKRPESLWITGIRLVALLLWEYMDRSVV